VIAAANAATTPTFVALYGQEYSTISKGNHANIQNYPIRISPSLNGKYGTVFGTVLPTFTSTNLGTVVFAEFNHPESFTKDYGLQQDFGGDIQAFVQTMDPFVKLIAVASGPADANNKNNQATGSDRFVHKDISTSRWFKYLSHGMHLAPKVDHDNHSPTYGFRHAGRTAVWVRGALTRDSLVRALSDRHCYATEDKNLRIIPTLSNGALPGDIVKGATVPNVTVALAVNDDDEPSAAYSIELYSGVSGDGQNPSPVSGATQTLSGNGSASLALQIDPAASLYYIIHVEQTSNDPVNNSNRSDAWLAPIWFAPGDGPDGPIDDDDDAIQRFVSSRNSDVYHFPDCRVVSQIAEHNLLTHEGVPEGKRLHQGCPLN